MEYKGISIETLRSLLRKHGRDESAFYGQLDPRLAKLARETMPIDWIPVADGAAIYAAAAKALFPQRPPDERLRAAGYEAAMHDLRGIYRAFMRVVSVQFVIQRSADLWGKYYRRGRATAFQQGDCGAVFLLADFPDFPTPMLETTAGYIAATVELTGARDVQVTTHADAGAFRWQISWK